MPDAPNTIIMLVKVLAAFFLITAVIPSRIIKFDEYADKPFDKLFISLTHANMVIILLAHLLSFTSIYDTFAVLLSLAAVYVILTRVKGRKLVNRFGDFIKDRVVNLLDISEGRMGLFKTLKKRVSNLFINMAGNLSRALANAVKKPFSGILTAAVLGFAAYLRFHHSLTTLYLGSSDSYVHLAWAKYMGNSEIYRDGVYPYGYHAVVSFLNKMFLLDPYYIERFLGPLAGFLIVLSILYVLKRYYREPAVIWTGLFLYVVNLSLPSDVWRQISALPQEYAAIFFLPGLHFFNLYLKSRKHRYLLLASECIALTLLIHPYVTVFTGMGYACLAVFSLKSIFSEGLWKRVTVYMVGAGFLGVLPLVTGLLIGYEWHGSYGYVLRMIQPAGQSVQKDSAVWKAATLSEPNTSLLVFLGSVVVAIMVLLFMWFKNRSQHRKTPVGSLYAFLFLSIMLYMLYRSDMFGLPAIMDLNRVGIFLSIIAVVVFSSVFYVYEVIPLGRKAMRLFKSVTALAIALIVVLNVNIKIPEGFQMEYDGAVYSYLEIKRGKFGSQNWTIVSPVEQYQQAMNYGWHFELWEFIYALEDAFEEPEHNRLEFLTDYVFIYVEKYPLYVGLPISYSNRKVSREYAEKPLPSPGEIIHYYAVYENRMILQSKAYCWAEEYMRKHDNMSVFYEDDVLKVYLIEQDSKDPIEF